MSNLYKNPMGDGSKFWAGDILTSLGITVDEAVDIEIGENSNGRFINFPSGLKIVANTNIEVVQVSPTRMTGNWTYPIEFTEWAVPFLIFENANTSPGINRGASAVIRNRYLHAVSLALEKEESTFTTGSSETLVGIAIGI